jgi:cell division protein FtsX
MKYKRQLMTTMFALSLFAGGTSALAAEDFVPNSKVSQYESQVYMKSLNKTNDENVSKKTIKRHKRVRKVNHQR